MSFQPIVPFGGYAGWKFLERTIDAQRQAHDAAPSLDRELSYFRDNITKVTSAEALVADYRLLKVALGAFGLEDDIGNRFFLRTILSEGTLDPEALANRMTDKRYKEFSAAFGFGDFDTPRTVLSGFADEITNAYKTRSFEAAIGQQDDNLRLAMNLDRELQDLAAGENSDETKWFSIMGAAPLRAVFDAAFGLPDSFAALDLDRQLEVYRSRAAATFGSADVAQFADPGKREDLIRLFLLRSEIGSAPVGLGPAQTALTLLQAMP